MASSNFYRRLAVFHIYLITTCWAQNLAPEVSRPTPYDVPLINTFQVRRSIWGSSYQATQGAPAVAITKTSASGLEPYHKVSTKLPNHAGNWVQVRSLGGPLALEWLQMHQEGHPNTTVEWRVFVGCLT